MYLLGYDIGSSSIKAALVEASTGNLVELVKYPFVDMDIISQHAGWAEQDPKVWWQCVCIATKNIIQKSKVDPGDIISIGIAYQMHGLVCVDKDQHVLRPSIIWCDSRAVEIGSQAFDMIGHQKCLKYLLNSPGNFTASKLKWVKENEPDLYDKIDKIMLPGDYIAMKLTGQINTTVSGLSETILWDFENHCISTTLLDHYGIPEDMIPDIVETFSVQGYLNSTAAESLGLRLGTAVSYRAGDQANNALSLGVLDPNEVAATGGTSGVVYGVINHYAADDKSRINSFAHVNHTEDNKRIGLLLCINGAGIQYSWIKNQIAREGISYPDMESMQNTIPVGSDGLRIIPFGNGAERILNNANVGAQIINLQFNRHSKAHLYRAALEGIAFSFVYGFQVLKEMGLETEVIKAGNDNLFQSNVFSSTMANLLGTPIEVMNTTGAIGAAKASGIAMGVNSNLKEAFRQNTLVRIYEPERDNEIYKNAYTLWKKDLDHMLNKL